MTQWFLRMLAPAGHFTTGAFARIHVSDMTSAARLTRACANHSIRPPDVPDFHARPAQRRARDGAAEQKIPVRQDWVGPSALQMPRARPHPHHTPNWQARVDIRKRAWFDPSLSYAPYPAGCRRARSRMHAACMPDEQGVVERRVRQPRKVGSRSPARGVRLASRMRAARETRSAT